MKKTILTLTLTLLISIQLFSQNDNKKLRLGINVGINTFDLKQNNVFDRYDGLIGYNFGISAEYLINEKLSLLSGINYDRKNMIWKNVSSVDPNFGSFSAEDKMKFSYINIPISVRYYIGKKNTFFVNTGGFYNYSLNIENETTVKETGEDITLFEHENVIKKYDYGISLGIGFRFDLNDKNHFSLELRNELGLANISDFSNSSLTDLKTNTIKLILNWELPI
jgi:hypothetical protein